MTTPLNLHALETFKKGERGYLTGEGVTKFTGPEIPNGSILVKAIEDVPAGKNGWFQT